MSTDRPLKQRKQELGLPRNVFPIVCARLQPGTHILLEITQPTLSHFLTMSTLWQILS